MAEDSKEILVIEDDADTRANLTDILELEGYRIRTADSAAQVLAFDAWGHLNAILLDRLLPDATAETLIPKIVERAPQAAILVVTGNADLTAAVETLRLGASDYIVKPINPPDLLARINLATASRRAAERIRFQATMLDQVSDAVVALDGDWRLIDWNRRAETLCISDQPAPRAMQRGARLSDIAGCDWLSPAIEKQVEQALTHDGSWSTEQINPRSQPQPTGMEIRITPLSDASMERSGALLVARDISHRLQIESDLRAQRDFAEGLVENAPAAVLLLDVEGRIRRVNRFLQELSGYSESELVGEIWWTRLVPPEQAGTAADLHATIISGSPTSQVLLPIRSRDGRLRSLRWAQSPLLGHNGEITDVLTIGQDITELREAQARAVRSSRLAAIGEMVAGLAHESRNALQRSQSCLEMLGLIVRDQPEALDLIQRIQRAQDDLHHLYEDVRTYAAPVNLAAASYSLPMVWRESWAQLEPQRRKRVVSLQESIEVDDPTAWVDPFRLQQVFRNIFENALAATPDPVRIEVSCRADLIRGRQALRVAVRDNGPGLSAEQRSKLFEPFFTTKTKGTGLGMAIVQRIIDAHEGIIRAGEPEGPGAEIIVVLSRDKP